MRRKTPKNASRPELDTLMDSYDTGFSPLAIASTRAVSTLAISSALGSADKQIEENSTTPTSSASPSCASLAAASSSFATANEIANVKSPPSADSASVAPPLSSSDADMSQFEGYEVTDTELKQASSEGFELAREGQRGPMRIRRLLFLRNDAGKRASGISKGRKATSARSRLPICFSSIFGATLKTILDFSGIATEKKAETAEALHEMSHFLGPVGDAIGKIDGQDRPHLINGLATQQVSSKQRKLLVECADKTQKNSWFHRSGLKDVTMGVTAGVLVAHYVMAATGCDAAQVTSNLTQCVDVSRELLKRSNLSRFSSSSVHRAALAAEIRALERARASAKAAEAVAASTGLDRLTALHLQLSYMRNAAYPKGAVCCGGAPHEEAVRKLAAGASIARHELSQHCFLPSTPVLQLLHVVGREEDSINSGSDVSSKASSSSASSIGSYDLDCFWDPQVERDVEEAVARMREMNQTETGR